MIWHYEWKNGHYCEWFDGERTHLKYMSQEEYEELEFNLSLS